MPCPYKILQLTGRNQPRRYDAFIDSAFATASSMVPTR